MSIQGKIEGYDSSSGYSSLSLIYDDYSEGTQTMMMVPVDSDGRFERSLDILHPKSSYMELEGEKGNRSIYWYVEPGDTLNITVKQDGTEEYALSDGRPYKLEHYSRCGLTGFSLYPFSEFMADGESLSQEEISAKITEKTALGQKLVDYLARKNNFSAYEYSYASYLVQSDLLTYLMDYRMNEKDRPLNELLAQKISYGQYDSLRRAVAVRQSDPEQLAPLREFKGANDIMFLSLPGVWPVFNRYKFDSAFTYGKNSIPRLNPCCLSVDSLLMENDKRIFKSDEPSLLGKLCLLQDLRMHLKQELEKNDSTGNEVCAKYLEGFKALIDNPNMAVKADWIAQDQAEKMKPYKELPDCKGKEVLDRILANYPGKYVYLDFWAVGCGPCRAGIESCRKLRPDLMGNNYDSLVLVFITDDREDVYIPYYEANLKGAESYRISHDDYLTLCDMFKFSGIPHHEYITPDGKACTNVPEMTSLDPKKPE